MTQPIRNYSDLVAWQKAFQVGVTTHRVTQSFPSHELYGLTSQLRRGTVAIASNIAEGYGRGSRSDYVRFLKIARGSLYEADTQLLFAVEFKYFPPDQYDETKLQLDEAERVLAGLIHSLEERSS